ncbi:MAG: hypothetical protein AAGD10_17610 [Myxococcota bacterium]
MGGQGFANWFWLRVRVRHGVGLDDRVPNSFSRVLNGAFDFAAAL